ncbi:MAG: NAD-dependent epimerase/dehydratase family protein [Chloroflexi bacterium]|nr:MAG: NAD-dependent epimerase/dehydratase family protein [Chloroflexota bacterium]
MRYVVTGAAGFIGSSVCDVLLEGGHEVVGIDCFTDYYPRAIKESNLARARAVPAFRFVELDLAEADVTSIAGDSDGVFHLAAQPGVRESWGAQFATYVRDGILATQRVLEAARAGGGKRVVYASSSSVYGNAERLPAAETATLRPISPYGISKHAGEELCSAYAAGFGVPAVTLRYFTVYGPRQRPDMAFHRFIKSALTGTPIRLHGDGSQSRDFTFVADAVTATVSAMTRGTPGAVYNIGGGARWTVREILGAIGRITGRTLNLLQTDAQPGDVRHTEADTTKARRELGYSPKSDVMSGLAEQVAWTRRALASGVLD